MRRDIFWKGKANMHWRQYERFLPAVGLAIDFSDWECLFVVTDYQATTKELDSRSTIVKREKTPTQPQSVSYLL